MKWFLTCVCGILAQLTFAQSAQKLQDRFMRYVQIPAVSNVDSLMTVDQLRFVATLC